MGNDKVQEMICTASTQAMSTFDGEGRSSGIISLQQMDIEIVSNSILR